MSGAPFSQDHVAFRVSDLDAAIDFYTRKLGLPLMFRQVDEVHHEAFAFIALDGGNLELLQPIDEANCPVSHVPPVVAPPYCPHLALRTQDLDAIRRLLDREGIAVIQGPLEIPGQVRWLYVADPDGNILEFVEWLNR